MPKRKIAAPPLQLPPGYSVVELDPWNPLRDFGAKWAAYGPNWSTVTTSRPAAMRACAVRYAKAATEPA